MPEQESKYASRRENRRESQSYQDERRKGGHFQVRLHSELAKELRHYMSDRNMNANQALNVIVSKFFH